MPSLNTHFERYREEGDPAALAAVFDRAAPDLLRVARALTSDVTDAEDLLQSTFLQAIESAGSFDSNRKLMPWLMGILVNQARNARRRAALRKQTEESDWEPHVPAGPCDPSDRTTLRELHEQIAAGLRKLPPVYREVLEPFLRDDANGVEIARRLGRAPGTVRMQLARGLSRLKHLLPAGIGAGLASLVPRPSALSRVRRAVLAEAGTGATNAAWIGASLKQSNYVLLATAIALATVGAFLIVPSSEAPIVDADPSGDSESLARVQPPPVAPSVPVDPSSPERQPLSVYAPEVEPAAEGVSIAADHEVIVVAAASQSPVPKATVHLVDLVRLPDAELLAFEAGGIDLARLLEDHAQMATADERGRVALSTWREGPVLIAGSKGDLSGLAFVGPDDERPILLQLTPSPPIRVRIVDSNGEPAIGVPVALRVVRRGESRTVFLSPTTGPDGIAELAHLEGALALGAGEQAFVGPELLLRERLEEPVHPSPRRGLIEFVLPPTGDVTFRLDGPNGQPARGTFRITATVLSDPASNPVVNRATASVVRPVVDGLCRFERVGLGLRLEARVQSSAYARQTSEHRGPASAGQELEIRLDPRTLPVVRARVLGRAGPLVEQRLKLVLKDTAADDSQRRSVVTDSTGRFDFELPRLFGGGQRTLEIEHNGPAGGRILVDLSHELQPGVNDRGDWRLEESPLLAAGQVLANDRPLSGALVHFYYLRERHGELRWDDLRERSVTTDRAGRFEMRGWHAGTDCAVLATHPSFAAGELQRIAPGDDQIVVRLEGGGRLSGRLRLDDGLPIGAFRVLVRDLAGKRRGEPLQLEKNGRFTSELIPRGRYALSAWIHFQDEVELIEVQVGQESDAAIENIDLRGSFDRFDLAVVDRAGNALFANVHFKPSQAPGEPWRSHPTSPTGSVTLVSPYSQLDVRVTCQGFAPLELRLDPGSTELLLDPTPAETP